MPLESTAGGHPDRTYEPLPLVRCLQRHPALTTRLRKLGESLYVAALLPPRTRTIAILRMCALVGCEYEWGGQAAFWGPIAGVRDEECDALVTGGAEDPRWGPSERTLIGAVDELECTGSWSEATWVSTGALPYRRATHRTAHGRRLVPDDLHAVQRAGAAGGGLDAALAVRSLTGPFSGPGAGFSAAAAAAVAA